MAPRERLEIEIVHILTCELKKGLDVDKENYQKQYLCVFNKEQLDYLKRQNYPTAKPYFEIVNKLKDAIAIGEKQLYPIMFYHTEMKYLLKKYRSDLFY